jgi:hypothetical protein
MSVSIAQQVDLLYKQAFGVTKTDTANNKSPSNESIPSPLLIRGDTQWVQSSQIPATAAAVPNVVQAYTGASAVQMVADNTTVPVGGIYPTWKTNLTYWIPQEFGATYAIKIYVDNPGAANPTSTGTQIFAAGSGGTGEFYYNYQSGVLNFIGETIPAALTSGKVLYAVGYRYIGIIGVQNLPANTQLGNLDISNTTISTTLTNANLIFAPNGTGQVTTTASFTGTNFYGSGITVGNATVNLELAGNTANFSAITIANSANLGNVANVTILGGSNGQVLSTNGSGGLSWVSVSSSNISNISNGNSNVSIPTANGNITISAAGNANIVEVSGTGVNVTGTLNVSGNANVGNIGTTGLIATGVSNLGPVGNVIITGGSNGQVLSTNGSGNLSWVSISSSSISNGNSNVSIPTADGNINLSASGNANVVVVSGIGANVVGNVYANGNGIFGAVKSNSVTALSANLQLLSEQTGNSFIELKPFGNGTVDVANFRITSVATPNAASDAATKQYVDDVAQGLHVHAPAQAATPDTLANITGGTITYNNGASGVGANLVTTGAFNLIDTVNVQTVGTRILVKNEANSAHNGIYTWANASTIVRALDFDTPTEMLGGDFTFVQQGNIYNDTGWVMTDPVTVVGTDPITWVQFSGAGTYQAGAGLTLTGTVFSVNVDNVTTAIVSGNVVVKSSAQLTSPNIDNATGTSLSVTGNVLANNINANSKVTANLVEVSSNVTSNNVTVNLALSGNTANFTGNLSAGNVAGGNLVTANFVTGTLTTNAQPNVTSLGVLSNLIVASTVLADGYSARTGSDLTIGVLGANANIIIAPQGTGITDFSNKAIANISSANILGNANIGNIETVAILASGNISGGNLSTGGELTVTGNANVTKNVNANNIILAGTGTVVNASSGNILTNEVTGTKFNFLNGVYTATLTGSGATANYTLNLPANAGSNGQVLTTNGSGNLSWTTIDTYQIQNGNSNVVVLANSNVTVSVTGTANVATFTQSGLVVSGTIGASTTITGDNVVANTKLVSSNLEMGTTLVTWGNTVTTATSANQTIAQFPVSGFVGVQFLVRGVDSVGSKYSVATVQAVTDGTTVDYATFGSVGIGGTTGLLAVNISGSNIALQVTPASSNSTTWTTQYRLV